MRYSSSQTAGIDVQRVTLEAIMQKGEDRYRKYLVSVLQETRDVMISSGEEVSLPINALINVVKLEKSNAK